MSLISLSTTEIKNIYLGDKPVEKAYIGNSLIFTEDIFLLDKFQAPFAYSLSKILDMDKNSIRARVDANISIQESDFTIQELENNTFLEFIPERLDRGFVFLGDNIPKCTIQDHPDLRVIGDITIIFHLKLSRWGNNIQTILRKGNETGNIGYRVDVDGIGKIVFAWSNDGITEYSITSSNNMPVTDGKDAWIKIDFDCNNGNGGHTVCFSKSFDGVDFCEFDKITESGTTTIYSSNDDLVLLQNMYSDGILYRTIIKNGIDGNTLFDANFSGRPSGSGGFLESTGKPVEFDFKEVFVAAIYNQGFAGSTGDLIQNEPNQQPKIYDKKIGLIKQNNKLAILFDGIDDYLVSNNFDSSSLFSDFAELYIVYQPYSDRDYSLFDDDNSSNTIWVYNDGQSYLGLFVSPRVDEGSYMALKEKSLLVLEANSSGVYKIYRNDLLIGEHTEKTLNVGNKFVLGSGFGDLLDKSFSGLFQQAIIFNEDNSSKRKSISELINSALNVYPKKEGCH